MENLTVTMLVPSSYGSGQAFQEMFAKSVFPNMPDVLQPQFYTLAELQKSVPWFAIIHSEAEEYAAFTEGPAEGEVLHLWVHSGKLQMQQKRSYSSFELSNDSWKLLLRATLDGMMQALALL